MSETENRVITKLSDNLTIAIDNAPDIWPHALYQTFNDEFDNCTILLNEEELYALFILLKARYGRKRKTL